MESQRALDADARRILEKAWRTDGDGGFCVPHATTYPWQWLWDSCFHSVVWGHLGDERSLVEIASALSAIDRDGFVPHMRYVHGPRPHADLWGRPDTSSITQPPMYGHALAQAARRGLQPDEQLVESACAGLRFLVARRRRSAAGLVELCHPWESGCDDSPRWDGVLPLEWSSESWFEAKGSLLRSVRRLPGGAPVHNDAFAVGSVGFSALVAFNALELVELTGDAELRDDAVGLADAVGARWEPSLATWVDDGLTVGSSAAVRTLDALLPLLVAPRDEGFAQLLDPGGMGARFGPRGVDVREPTYDPARYWRGSAWPQLTYLLWVAAGRAGRRGVEDALARTLVAGATTSGYAEHWSPDTAEPLGAVPQTWSTLAAVVAAPAPQPRQ